MRPIRHASELEMGDIVLDKTSGERHTVVMTMGGIAVVIKATTITNCNDWLVEKPLTKLKEDELMEKLKGLLQKLVEGEEG